MSEDLKPHVRIEEIKDLEDKSLYIKTKRFLNHRGRVYDLDNKDDRVALAQIGIPSSKRSSNGSE